MSIPTASAAVQGTPCAQPVECDSGFCVDGVCCDRACSGVCETCRSDLKQSGRESGRCGPVRAGMDPDSECERETPDTCGRTGSCAGISAACALWPSGTSCGATECQCNAVRGSICSGTGQCYRETSFLPCGGGTGDYLCLDPGGRPASCTAPQPGGCALPCTSDQGCNNDYRCVEGVCVARLGLGARCVANDDCANHFCADGYCCSDPCRLQCEACNLLGKEGTCSPVTGDPVAPRAPCGGSGRCKGQCAGKLDGCLFPGADTQCVPAACVHDAVRTAAICDGTGACLDGEVYPCGEFTCDPSRGECFVSCTSRAECAMQSVCDVSTGRGTCRAAGATCEDTWSVRQVDGTVLSCKGYACLDGQCLQRCSQSADCADGFLCGSEQRCQLVASGAGEGSGGDESSANGLAGDRASGDAGPDGAIGAHTAGVGGGGPSASSSGSGCGCRVGGGERRTPVVGWGAVFWAVVVGLGAINRRSRQASHNTEIPAWVASSFDSWRQGPRTYRRPPRTRSRRPGTRNCRPPCLWDTNRPTRRHSR